MVLDDINKYPDILERWPVGIMVIGPGGAVEAVNRPFCYGFGVEPGEVVGRELRVVLSRDSVRVGDSGGPGAEMLMESIELARKAGAYPCDLLSIIYPLPEFE